MMLKDRESSSPEVITLRYSIFSSQSENGISRRGSDRGGDIERSSKRKESKKVLALY